MSYFNDMTVLDSNIQINGVTMPQTSTPVKVEESNVSDGGRLADNINYEGTLKGVKKTITLHYNQLNRRNYKRIYDATQGSYDSNGNFFMSITVPDYKNNGTQTIIGYFQSTTTENCTETTDKYAEILGATYSLGRSSFDCMFEDVEFKFVQK